MLRRFLVLFFCTLIVPPMTMAWLMPAKMVLEKTVDHAGSSVTVIEQMVSFHEGDQTYQVRETWSISSPKLMKLTLQSVSGAWNSQILYNNNNRMQVIEGRRVSKSVSPDLFEGIFSTRSVDQLAELLSHWGIQVNLRDVAAIKDSSRNVQPSPTGLRLSRTQGIVAYAFGEVSRPEAQTLNPQLWIEQDQWVIRKLRLPSQVQIRAENYQEWSKNFKYPQTKKVNWNHHEAVIAVTKASSKNTMPVGYFAASKLESSTSIDLPEGSPLRTQVEEFYSRMR